MKVTIRLVGGPKNGVELVTHCLVPPDAWTEARCSTDEVQCRGSSLKAQGLKRLKAQGSRLVPNSYVRQSGVRTGPLMGVA